MTPDPTLLRGELPPGPGRVGPFRVLERIGSGGMGVVWLAERREPIEQRVALKVIRSDRLDKAYRARFEMEQQALSRMDHPNIARLLDAGDDAGQSWFAMEYVPGQPLADYCAEHRLSIEQRLALFLQICDGVQHAHVKGILHRDLKPGNILVREVDGRPVAKIIDFGLAQPVDPLQIRATLHESPRQIVGTFAYMSPEQALRTEGDLDTRTDVYSLGVVLYELLTGQLPIDLGEVERHGIAWFGEFLREHEPPKPSTRLSTLGERLSTTAAERCLSPQRLRAFVRGELDWVTMKALARDRQRRYLTVQQLRGDVERFLKHHPVEAGPPGFAYSARKWLRRHRTAVGMAVGATVALSTLVTMDLAHAATTLRLEREAALASEPMVAEGLLEARRAFGCEEGSEAPALVWLERVRTLLDHVPQQRERASAAGDPALAGYLQQTVPALTAATTEVEDLIAGIRWVREQMHELTAVWHECAQAVIADTRYGLRSLPPQFGLVPLGRDPQSGLFEFELLDARGRDAGGERRVLRGADGALEFGVMANAVFVLLPGGTFTMGTDPADQDWFDARTDAAEAPAHEVSVTAFFCGKYEATQAQCCGGAEDDPSYWQLREVLLRQKELRDAGVATDVERTRRTVTRPLPISDLTWVEASQASRRLGVRLLREAEWELAARAGTAGPWSCDDDEATLRRHGNLADCLSADVRLPLGASGKRWLVGSDGFAPPAGIGLFLPNTFGLHDMHGNVFEWCAEPMLDYERDGVANIGRVERSRVLRGGSFQSAIGASRSAARRSASMFSCQRDLGFRFARDVIGGERR
ncbi:MAG: protein kinase [Planctomycetes bacterium]|nr:protein kinase [Planctomycetota bacterium]MCC7398241.1 protein kinase [Planctomycetota bacterium]